MNSKKPSAIMTYSDFLTALMRISVDLYADAPNVSTVDAAFQKLLIENILPPELARRRRPQTDMIANARKDASVQAVFDCFRDSLAQIFQYYSVDQDMKEKKRRRMKIV